ncbi:hypothetical protein ACJMK2_002062 [Sinanodonta woodiana]|uniref:TRIM56 n=1 Tax=Sinanodonta woodiana TaxID=1069815 RepID=A0ABD3XXL6_SINWO
MATASQVEELQSEALQCPICLEMLRKPKVLPCGHCYCASCLQSHINSKVIKQGIHQAYFPCPVCRAGTYLSDPKVNVERWAEIFPVNSKVPPLLELAEETHGIRFCDKCNKWNIQSTAVSVCNDCKRFMCEICKKHHNENHSQLRHDVIDLNSENTSCFTIPNLSAIEICRRHPKKSIEFYCKDHSSLCCSRCGFLEHRKCERVITIEDMFQTFDIGTTSRDLEANLRNIGSHLKQMTSKVKENAESIKTDKSAILQEIRNLKSEINKQLRKLEDDLIASLEGNHKSEDLNLHNQEAKCQSLIIAIENDLTKYDLVMTHGSEAQKVIMLHNMAQSQNKYQKTMSEYNEDMRHIKFRFCVNKRVKDLLKELDGFGVIKVTRTKHVDTSCLAETPSQPKAEVVSGSIGIPLKNRKAVKITDFNVKVQGDSAVCHISDVITLPGANHILVDRANSKIKVFGEDYQFQESMAVQGNPWNVCILPDNNIAVTVPNNKTIVIIGIADKMKKITDLRTRLSCWGIAVFKKRLIIITCNDEDCILILDMTGAEVSSVRPDNYISDKLICPWYVKVNKSEIYVSYSFGHKMVAYNRLWNTLFTYTDQNMALPDGIETDREGNVYLCGYDSYNVQQISADGRLIRTLITKKKDKLKPRTLRFYRDRDRFIVSYCNSNCVEVYDICD